MKNHRFILFALIFAVAMAAFGQKAAFNIATYNIRQMNDGDVKAGNGWSVRAPHVAQLVQFHDFDIFGTQEGFKIGRAHV